jgi:hypothetical protein
MTGYVRKDTTNNIADGNVINASDLDAEFDGVKDAFQASTGHKHDGTTGEGAPITSLGPNQDVTISATLLAPKTTNTVDIGSSALKFKDLFLAGNGSVGGTLAVTGVATLTANPVLSAGTANGVLYLNGSKVVTSGSALTFDGTDVRMPSGGSILLGASASGASLILINGTAAAQRLVLGTSGTDAVINATRTSGTSPNIIFQQESSELMRLTSTGLGIGTSTITGGYKAQINGNLLLSSTSPLVVGNSTLTLLGDNTSATGLLINTAGNLGLGVTPSAWSSTWRALDVDTRTAIISAGNKTSIFANNAVFESAGWKYKASQFAGSYAISTTTGNHEWSTAPSGTAGNAITFTQAMTLDASGNLGVGTTSPFNPGSTAQKVIELSGSAYSTIFLSASSATVRGQFGADAVGSTVNIGARTNHPLTFATNDTERARIDSSGNLLVGINTKLAGGLAGIDINNASPTGITLGVSGSQKGYFYTNPGASRIQWETVSGYTAVVVSGGAGGVSLANSGTAWAAISDERHKDIIEPITNAAQKVSSLRAVIGKYKTDEEGTRRSFLIAQDVQAVLPEAIDEEQNEEKTLSLKYTEVIPLLVAAIQEQQAIIESMKTEIDALKAKVGA